MAREAKEAKRQRAVRVATALAKAYPRSTCALRHETPFQLLVATVLSAQTTDLAVNKATRELFRRFPTAKTLALAPAGAIESCINGIGLWRAKAKNVRELSRRLADESGGDLPRTVEGLTALPGVGRKTATAVLGTAYGLAAGVTVDTHMLRINQLLRLSTATDATKMGAQLEDLLPSSQWPTYTHRIIDHGRLVCVANRPRCGVCPIAKLCPSAGRPSVGYKASNDAAVPASAKGLSWLRDEVPLAA